MLGFITGMRALLASQYAIQTTAQNIANANTEGYSRQEVILKSSTPAMFNNLVLGTGVEVAQVNRVVDQLLDIRIRQQTQLVGRLDMEYEVLSDLEGTFGSLSENSLNMLLGKFFNDLSSLSASPQDVTLRAGVLRTGVSMANNFNQLSGQLDSMKESIGTNLEFTVSQINYLSFSIGQLNLQISSAVIQGFQPSDLLDQRELLLKELSEFIDIQTQTDTRGNIGVRAGGTFLVSEGRSTELEADVGLSESKVRVKGGSEALVISGGKLKGLLDSMNQLLPAYEEKLDLHAHEIIREFNKIHSQGIGLNGPFTSMLGTIGMKEHVGSDAWRSTFLEQSNLPFPPRKGELIVTMTDEATGAITRHRISIDPRSQRITDIEDMLDDITGLNASVDGTGRLRLTSEPGYGFDFSTRLDPAPDNNGLFGSAAATIASIKDERYNITNGESITVEVDGGAPQTVAFNSADFMNINAATAEEVAAVINRDTIGVQASAVNGKLVLQSENEGPASSLRIQNVGGGTAAGALGLSTALETGGELSVETAVYGNYEGSENDILTFRPKGSGIIGTTEGLVVEVFSSAGEKVTEINVGSGYTPGDAIRVWEGVEVSFSEGTLNEASGEHFTLDVIADSDTADFLPAFGLNALFEGTDAHDIRIRDFLMDRPGEFAASLNGNAGDNSNIIAFLDIQEMRFDALGTATFEGFYRNMEGDLGFATARTQQMLQGQAVVLENMNVRRENISGVSVDEEFMKLTQHQKAFEAAARFIDVMVQITNIIVHLGE